MNKFFGLFFLLLPVFASAHIERIECGYPFNSFMISFDALGFPETATASIGYSSYSMVCQDKNNALIHCEGKRIQVEDQKTLIYKAKLTTVDRSLSASFVLAEKNSSSSRVIYSTQWMDCSVY